MKKEYGTSNLEGYLTQNASRLKSAKEDLSTYRKAASADDKQRKMRAKRLQDFRKKELGLTQSELARAVGANIRTFQSWEHGRQTMPKSIEILMKLMGEMPSVRRKLINKKAS